MMKLWSERYAKTTLLVPSAVASVVVHAALIGASVVITANPIIDDVPWAPSNPTREDTIDDGEIIDEVPTWTS